MYFVLKKPHKNLSDKTTGTDTCRTKAVVVSLKKVQSRIVLSLTATEFLKNSTGEGLE